METNTPGITSQERIAGAFAYIFFLIPHLMDRKTEFTQFHAKQSFFLCIIMVVSGLIPFFGTIIAFMTFCVAMYVLFQAYRGNKFYIPYIAENMDSILTKMGLIELFSKK